MPQIQGGANDLCIRRSLTRAVSSLATLGTTSKQVRNHEQRETRDICRMAMMKIKPAAYMTLAKKDARGAGGEGRRLAVSLSLRQGK